MNFSPEIIGMLAATLTTAAYVPQAVKVLREKDTKSLSLGMYIILNGGIASWLIYGLMIGSMSLIFANSISLVVTLTILFMKIRHG